MDKSRLWEPLLPDSVEVTAYGVSIGGRDVGELAETYGTPLYVYDELTLRESARRIQAAFAPLGARVSYAAKACAILGVLRVFREEGLDLDAVSEGEMEAGARAGFDPGQIHLHGNCKSDAELERAIESSVRAIVVDSVEEMRRVVSLCRVLDREARVALRLCLSLEADTHPHLQTGGGHSKFGVLRGSHEELEAVALVKAEPRLSLVGLHTHVGSQITDAGVYGEAAIALLAVADELRGSGIDVEEVSLGGGWAVPYASGEPGLDPECVAAGLRDVFAGVGGTRPAVEPGRALVARAGVAVYRVGAVKVRGAERLVAVDGGMGDNPRPALYGAKYTALLPDRPLADATGPATVVGRYCESGDVLVADVSLPPVACGDLICVPASGAYQLAMASAYNLVPPPPAVMVRDRESRVVSRRGTVGDLLSRQC